VSKINLRDEIQKAVITTAAHLSREVISRIMTRDIFVRGRVPIINVNSIYNSCTIKLY
jgi:hypothetical protein